MSILPVVARELRVASRQASTFWLRLGAALVAGLLGTGCLLLAYFAPPAFGWGGAALGRGLFSVLTWICFGAVLVGGMFFTSDCLSQEKREGTLGLLFLTDLRGYDVVLGKLLATSLRGAYAMLAVFPILAMTLLLGSVRGTEVGRASLALISALLASLSAGMLASVLSRDAQKALVGALLLVVVWLGGGPLAEALIEQMGYHGPGPSLSLTSPVVLMLEAGRTGSTRFATGLEVNLALTVAMLGLTSVLVPRSWEENARRDGATARRWSYWWRFGSARRRLSLSRKTMHENPVLWLACRERWQGLSFWMLTAVVLGGLATMLAVSPAVGWWMGWNQVAGMVGLLVYLGITSHATRFFVDAKRNGILELLLAAPLPARAIVQGQWKAMLRMFGLPVALCLAAQVVGKVAMDHQSAQQTAGMGATRTLAVSNNVTVVGPGGTTNVTVVTGPLAPSPRGALLAMSLVGEPLVFVANLGALVWFGMWTGLNARGSNMATLKTLVWVQVVPWITVSFFSMLGVALLFLPGVMGGSSGLRRMQMFPILVTGTMLGLTLAKDYVFVLWSRGRLYSQFRTRAVEAVYPVRQSAWVAPPPVISPPAPIPAGQLSGGGDSLN